MSYQVTDLGTLPGATDSVAHGINNAAQVVGNSGDIFGRVPRHAFLWDATHGMQDLGTLPGDAGSEAVGINDSSQVVGVSYTTSRVDDHAFLWDAVNGMRDLGTLPGDTESFASGINDSGQVVGSSCTSFGPCHAFLWDVVNGMQDLGTLPGDIQSSAGGINNNGQVVGESFTPRGFSHYHAFLWDAVNGMQDLGTLPDDTNALAEGINDSGQVVGKSYGSLDNRAIHAFLWNGQGMEDLGTLGRDAIASSINSNGQVVGWSEVYDPIVNDYFFHAFVWQNGTMSNLKDLIPPGSGWDLGAAYTINNAGLIVGSGFHMGNGNRAFLLTPDSSARTGPAGTVHLTGSDAPAVLLADSTVTAADAGAPTSSLTLDTLGDQTLTVTDTAEATRSGRATVAGTSDGAAPAGRTMQNATDAVFASSHRANASEGGVTELEREVSLLPNV